MNRSGIYAVLLAAGKSSRMRKHKLGLPLLGTTIGSVSLQNAINSELAHLYVVTREGDSLDWIHPDFFQAPLRTRWTAVACTEADKGQAYSLQCGLRAATYMKPKGVMVLLADQPFLSVQLINNLIKNYKQESMKGNSLPFLGASFQGIPRPPIIFSPETFPQLFQLTGDEGARKLIQKQKQNGVLIDYRKAIDFIDIDTKEDYEGLKGVGIRYD